MNDRNDAAMQRKFWLDLIRIGAFFGVVLLHTAIPYTTANHLFGHFSWWSVSIINAFVRAAVPLFFMLSGCLLLGREETVITFYRQRIPRLLLVLTVWHSIYFFADVIKGVSVLSFHNWISQLLNNGSRYHLWYLYTIVGIYLLLPFLAKLCKACSLQEIAILFLIAIFPGAIRPLLNYTLPVYIYLFDVLLEPYLGYVLLGFLLSRISLRRCHAVTAAFCVLIGVGMCVFGNTAASSAESVHLIMNGGYMLNHFLTAGGLFVLIRLLFGKTELPEKQQRIVSHLSAASFPAYGVHVLILGQVQQLPFPTLPITVHLLLVAAITAVLSLLFGLLARSMKWSRWLCG